MHIFPPASWPTRLLAACSLLLVLIVAGQALLTWQLDSPEQPAAAWRQQHAGQPQANSLPAHAQLRQSAAEHRLQHVLILLVGLLAGQSGLLVLWLRQRRQGASTAPARDRQADQQDRRKDILRRVAEQMPGLVLQWQVRPDGKSSIPYASERFYEQAGLAPQRLRQDVRPLLERIDPRDQTTVLASLARAGQQLSPWFAEFRVQHAQLGSRWLQGRASPERLSDGSTLWHALLLDISEQKQTHVELAHERERLHSFLEGANCGTWELNVASAQIRFDRRGQRMLGYQPVEPLVQDFSDWQRLIHDDDRETTLQALQQHLAGNCEQYQALFRMRHRDGHWLWVEARGRLLRRTPEGDPLLVCGTHVDISSRLETQRQYEQEQTLLRTVLSSSTTTAIIATDEQGVITLFNRGAELMLGYPSGALVGTSNPALFHLPEEMQARGAELSAQLGRPVSGFAVFIELARQGGSDTRQWTYLHKDGHRLQVQLTVTQLRDSQNRVLGYMGIASDISELTRMNQALQTSEQRFRGMLRNLPGAAYRCRNDSTWTMYHISDEIERITGYPASDFIDNRVRSFSSIVLPEDLHITFQDTHESLKTGELFELSYRLRHRDGHAVWVSEKGRAELDEQGQLLWIDGYIWDISEQRAAEQQLREHEAYLSALLDNVVDAIIGIDEQGRIESFNRAAERLFGYPAKAILGQNVSMLMPEPDQSRHDQYILNHQRSGQSRVIGVPGRELQGRRRDGSLFHLELAVSTLPHLGSRRFVGVIRDITERKRIDALKNEFVATVSHELRTPLTSISGALGLINGGALGEPPEAMRDLLAIAQHNSWRLGQLINDLLDMEKLSAGKMTLELCPTPLRQQLEEALQNNQPYADEHQVHWRLAEPLSEAWVQVDAQRLQQVLANLLSNAAKFSPPGSTVWIRTSSGAAGIRVSVEDQGAGIPPQFQAQIFAKFAQADASDSRRKGGTGLGLAISKELIERMHGRIGFTSTPDQGSCFWFELPEVSPP